MSNVRFIGFTDEELRNEVNVDGREEIHVDCSFNTDIFSLLMRLGAEVRFRTTQDLDHVIVEAQPSVIGTRTTDSDGKQHFDTSVYKRDINLNIIEDRDRCAITGVAGFVSILTEVLSRNTIVPTWNMFLDGVIITFGFIPMEEAILHNAGVFGSKPKRIKCATNIKIPDGKTPWDELPSVKWYINDGGYVFAKYDSLPENIKRQFSQDEEE